MTLLWKDKKDVAMLSTIHKPAMHDIETRQGSVKNLICFAHRHNNEIDNTHKKKSLVAKAREHQGTFRLSSRDTP